MQTRAPKSNAWARSVVSVADPPVSRDDKDLSHARSFATGRRSPLSSSRAGAGYQSNPKTIAVPSQASPSPHSATAPSTSRRAPSFHPSESLMSRPPWDEPPASPPTIYPGSSVSQVVPGQRGSVRRREHLANALPGAERIHHGGNSVRGAPVPPRDSRPRDDRRVDQNVRVGSDARHSTVSREQRSLLFEEGLSRLNGNQPRAGLSAVTEEVPRGDPSGLSGTYVQERSYMDPTDLAFAEDRALYSRPSEYSRGMSSRLPDTTITLEPGSSVTYKTTTYVAADGGTYQTEKLSVKSGSSRSSRKVPERSDGREKKKPPFKNWLLT